MKLTSEQVTQHLLRAGVSNLKVYGYPDVNEENILTDPIYSAFFKSMLTDNLGQGVDDEIKALRDKIAD